MNYPLINKKKEKKSVELTKQVADNTSVAKPINMEKEKPLKYVGKTKKVPAMKIKKTLVLKNKFIKNPEPEYQLMNRFKKISE